MKVTVVCSWKGGPTISPAVQSYDEYGMNYSTTDHRGLVWELPKKMNYGSRIVDAGRKWNEVAEFFATTLATKVHIGLLVYPNSDDEYLIVQSHGFGTTREPPIYSWFKTPPKHESRAEVVRRMVEVNMTAQLARWLTS